MARKLITALTVAWGFLFLTAYIRSATVDVVYTDYMRLINTYLPNVADPSPYLHADALERIPVTYLERLFNVKVLGYSTTFDMMLGAAGLAACAAVIGRYCIRRGVSMLLIQLVMFIIFSLDKWEMLTNGTGWVHFWAMAFFYGHFALYDRVRTDAGAKYERRLLILPALIMFLIAGPYCAAYAGCVCLIYLADCMRMQKEGRSDTGMWIRRFASVLIPFGLYFLSHISVEYEYAVPETVSLGELVTSDPGFLAQLLIKSFTGLAVVAETAQAAEIPDAVLMGEGIAVLTAYITAVILNVKTGLYKKTVLPMMLMIMALLSHGLIVASRWIFLDSMYSMSSRYALQYMGGSIGILLTLFYACKTKANRTSGEQAGKMPGMQKLKKCEEMHGAGRHIGAVTAFTLGICVLILSGQCMNYVREIHMAPYRKEAFENMRQTALDFENSSDEELKSVLQYRDPEKIRKALGILRDNEWNVFRR